MNRQAHESDFGISQKLTVNARAAGPRLGRQVQDAIRGSKSGDWSVASDGTVTSGGLALEPGEYALETVVESVVGSVATGLLPGGGFVVLDTLVTADLAAEGLARDLIRAIQDTRKAAGLAVSDRIALRLGGDPEVREAARRHADLIAGETLATAYDVSDVPPRPDLPGVPVGDARILGRPGESLLQAGAR